MVCPIRIRNKSASCGFRHDLLNKPPAADIYLQILLVHTFRYETRKSCAKITHSAQAYDNEQCAAHLFTQSRWNLLITCVCVFFFCFVPFIIYNTCPTRSTHIKQLRLHWIEIVCIHSCVGPRAISCLVVSMKFVYIFCMAELMKQPKVQLNWKLIY